MRRLLDRRRFFRVMLSVNSLVAGRAVEFRDGEQIAVGGFGAVAVGTAVYVPRCADEEQGNGDGEQVAVAEENAELVRQEAEMGLHGRWGKVTGGFQGFPLCIDGVPETEQQEPGFPDAHRP